MLHSTRFFYVFAYNHVIYRITGSKGDDNYQNDSGTKIKKVDTLTTQLNANYDKTSTSCVGEKMLRAKKYTYDDYNSREGIANILKGTLLSGVVHVNPHTGMIRTPSPSNSPSRTKYGPKRVESSSSQVI